MNGPDDNTAIELDGSDPWDITPIVRDLRAQRERWRSARQRRLGAGGREFPSREVLECIVAELCGVLFPMRLGPNDLHRESEDYYVGHTLDRALRSLHEQVRLELGNGADTVVAARYVRTFAAALPGIRALLDADVEAAYAGDPAAGSVDEVLLCYPGVRAVIHHRLAHQLHVQGLPLLARIVAEIAHAQTGIDIHPGARVGRSFFIDHGTGVVIGETAVIGEHVRLYQAVTLGAKSFRTAIDGSLEKGLARHPVVEDDVVIYAGATILGRITIGRGSVIGGNVWLTHGVPPGSHVTQATTRHELVSH